jgi:hypothetical protein
MKAFFLTQQQIPKILGSFPLTMGHFPLTMGHFPLQMVQQLLYKKDLAVGQKGVKINHKN